MFSVEMLSKKEPRELLLTRLQGLVERRPTCPLEEDFSPNFGNKAPNTEFGLPRCCHTPHSSVSVLVCQSIAVLSAKSRTFTTRRHHATSTSHRFGPFGSHDVNPTEALVESFPSLLPIKNPFGNRSRRFRRKRILSVDQQGSIWTANELEMREWDAILHMGLCGECTHPRIELLAEDILI